MRPYFWGESRRRRGSPIGGFLALLALGFLVLRACDSKVPEARAPLPTLVLRSSSYGTLNPLTRTTGSEASLFKYLLQPYLLTEDPDTGDPMPWFAESMPEVSDDQLTQTWTIREGAEWEDKVAVTTDDVVYSWEMLGKISDKGAVALKGKLGGVERIEAIDRRRFRVVYDKFYFRAVSAFGLNFTIAPKHAMPSEPKKFSETTRTIYYGPYSIESWSKEELVLVRKTDWWGDKHAVWKDKWRTPRFVNKVVADSVQVREQLKSGLLDFAVFDDFIEFVDRTRGEPWDSKFDRASYLLAQYCFIGWNHADPLFADPRVRSAMSHLLRRDEIASGDWKGAAKPISSPYFVGGSYGDPAIKPHPYDLARAKALLKEAGWSDSDSDGVLDKDGKKFEFTMQRVMRDLGWVRAPIDYLVEDTAAVGIKMNVQKIEDNTLFEGGRNHKFQACIVLWGIDPVAPDVYTLFHSSQSAGGENWWNYKSDEMDRLLEAYRGERSLEKRYALSREIHATIHRDQPVTFVLMPAIGILSSKRLKGLVAHKLGVRQWDFYLDK